MTLRAQKIGNWYSRLFSLCLKATTGSSMVNADILILSVPPNALNVMECSSDIPLISLRFDILYQKRSHATLNFHTWKPSYELDGELCPELLANEAITNIEGD